MKNLDPNKLLQAFLADEAATEAECQCIEKHPETYHAHDIVGFPYVQESYRALRKAAEIEEVPNA